MTPAACISRILRNSRVMASASSCAVGSSSTTNRAPRDTARAISTNWRCSTDSSLAIVAGSTSTPSGSSTARARRRIAPHEMNRWSGLRKRFSATDNEPMTVERWYTHATSPRQRSGWLSGGADSPWKRISPESGASSPVMSATNVDLPAPLRPTRAWVWPAATAIDTSSRATVVPKRLVSPDVSTTGGGSPPSSTGVASAGWSDGSGIRGCYPTGRCRPRRSTRSHRTCRDRG